jgi:integrase
VKLDAKTVNGLTLLDGKKDAIHFDEMFHGFGYRLRLSRNGKKVLRSWVVQYRHGGRQRRIRIGNADIVSAEQARSAAKKILAKVELGQDPQAAQIERREKDKLLFQKVAADFLADKRDTNRPRTHVEKTRYLTGQYFKDLHTLAIDKIERKHVAACLVTIKHSGHATAGAAKAQLSAFFTWCMQKGLLEKNPAIGTEDFEDKKRDRVLTNKELAAVWNACDGDDDYSRIVRLLVQTGCRRDEVGGMVQSELKPNGMWVIPGERTKNHHEHMLPLPATALDIVNLAPATGEHLFGRAGFQTWGKAKAELNAKLDDVAAWQLRDLRRTVATGMANIGILPHVIEAVLNHQSGHKAGVAGVYNRAEYLKDKRIALAMWADHVQALATGTERKIAQHPAIAA